MGQAAKALPYFEQAVAMRQKLYPAARYPDGHPDLAQSLNNLGFGLQAMGLAAKALPYYEQSLAMRQDLYPAARYPVGHPDLATSLDNRGALLLALGQAPKALPYVEQALAMKQKLGWQILDTASEAEALAYVQAQPLTRDGFLSLTTKLPGTDEKAYTAVWSTKSAVTRVLAQRHAAARVAGTEHAKKLEELKATRRYVDYLLRNTRLGKDERDKLLTKAVDERDALERELAKAVPLLQRARELDALEPDALLALLPEHAVLIDFVRYTRFEFDSDEPGKAGEMRTPSYAAFVLAKTPLPPAPLPRSGREGRTSIVRIELSDAAPIDETIAAWRHMIQKIAGEDDPDTLAKLKKLVWEPIAKHLPAGTTNVYIAPDGDLARLPWCALPGSKPGTILLEDFTGGIAIVPHGPFLLEQLKFPHNYEGPEPVFALGAVSYNSKTWRDLPGTAGELKALGARNPITLTGADAKPAQVMAELPKARYAHFATHGFFNEEELAAERKRADDALKNWHFIKTGSPRPLAHKNPLGFTGLVLANGEVLTGFSIVDLPLENVKLVTLSACDTGLGERTGAEGVIGLQRAFHLAGCPNVVASLWQVNDTATAALMAKFYHEMWVNKREPLAALREAQLTIYYHPELIHDLAGERGAPKLKEAIAVQSVASATAPTARQADTKLWAAFVLSGVGK
jgi:CHAT domain-containing protein